MDLKSKKMAVLEQLKCHSESLSLGELLLKLGDHYSDRSVRRYLQEMVQDGLVEKLGDKRSSRYRAILENEESFKNSLSPESKNIIAEMRRPFFERPPVTYNDDWIASYKPNTNFYIPKNWRLKLHMAGARSRKEDPAGTYAHQIYQRLLIDLSYNSSRLEGNTYSLAETQKLLLEGAVAEGKLDEEKIMILNHKEAILYLVNGALNLEVTTQTICNLHYLLSDGLVEARDAGKVRSHGVKVTGSAYIPFEDPKQLQSRLDLIIKKASEIKDPYEQSFFLLVHISYLQAFADVNKRTARLSSNIPLVKSNLVPLSFNDVDKDDYISAIIAIYELQEVGPFLDLYMFSYVRTCALYEVTVKAFGFDEVRVRYRTQRRELIRQIILNELKGKDLKKYISRESAQIPKEDRELFVEDLFEDLKEMDSSRIIGLGITEHQLKYWLDLQKS